VPDDGLRFLLDQGFPNPRLPVGQLQTNVEYVHLSAHAPELSKKSAPDWMLYLVAEAGGFDGVIAKDFRQVEQPEELIALTRVPCRRSPKFPSVAHRNSPGEDCSVTVDRA
jgi:hypothetical protein